MFSVGRRGQRRAGTHVSGASATAARSDSARRIHCRRRQSRRQAGAASFLPSVLPPLLFLDGWRIPKEGLFRDKGTILELALGLGALTVLRRRVFHHLDDPGDPVGSRLRACRRRLAH